MINIASQHNAILDGCGSNHKEYSIVKVNKYQNV